MDKERLVDATPKDCSRQEPWKGNVIILPGGAYVKLSPREAQPVADAFAAIGWKPWILYYTVYDGEPLKMRPILEAAEAVKYVRENGADGPVVLCGFSAGGHVAATLGVHWNDGTYFSPEEQYIVRPDGLILAYSVVTVWPDFSEDWKKLFMGERDSYSEEEWNRAEKYFCLENYVNSDTAPTFLWHTAEDDTVPVYNSLLFAGKLSENHVPFELHIYPYGAHGLSLATKVVDEPEKNRLADAHVAGWFNECAEWLDTVKK